ncbi:MAG: hypothetical protein HYS06_01895 [Methylocystis sp.]|nr:hypothetical protein [Methylocystis sp.]
MMLQRMKNNIDASCEKESLDWTWSHNEASIDFPKFGNGTERHSDFRVTLTWRDIEEIMKAMANKNHEGALRAQRALHLANAIEDLFRNSN